MKMKSTPVSQSQSKESPPPAGETAACKTASCPQDLPLEQLIAEEAYFLAEQRGFTPNNDLADWLIAEANVKARLGLTQSQ